MNYILTPEEKLKLSFLKAEQLILIKKCEKLRDEILKLEESPRIRYLKDCEKLKEIYWKIAQFKMGEEYENYERATKELLKKNEKTSKMDSSRDGNSCFYAHCS